MNGRPNVLIVDDEERNVRLLKALLAPQNYEVRQAFDGEEALRRVAETPPDLVLLDVMMPRINGFEICRRLKGDEKTKAIPVILVTALADKKDRMEGLDSGADDFISKPVDQTELTIRVKSLLRIKSYQDEISEKLSEIAAKEARLRDLEKIRDGLWHMIIHDLRNPLTAITTHLQLLALGEDDAPEARDEAANRCLAFCRDLDRMIQNLLDISKMEEGKMPLQCEEIDVGEIVGEVLEGFGPAAEKRNIALSFSRGGEVSRIHLDASILKRVVTNLVDNAVRYTPRGGTIAVGLHSAPPEGISLYVRDSGCGLPP
ncbi:MAG TPA: response regulator, partial [Thermodesulfobacteriota bacterium]|nr:response regulator [Thermodesulfobacteriota bacterium]